MRRLAGSLVLLAAASAACERPSAGAAREDASAPMATAAAIAPSAEPHDDASAVAARPDANVEGWCTEGLEALDAETCVVVPDHLASPRTLLVYLHGTIAPKSGTQHTVQQVVRENANKRGYVALMPRGRQGIGPNKIPDWWAWPTTADAHRKYARGMIEQWLASKAQLEARLGPFEKTFLGGSSNGAYFLSTLALKGEIQVDGFGAFSGGSRSGFTEGRIAGKDARVPFYVGYGTYDDSKDLPIALGEFLRQVGWPSKVAAHAIGHGANGIYLDEAMTFWGGP